MPAAARVARPLTPGGGEGENPWRLRGVRHVDVDLDAAVLGAVVRRVVRGDRLRLAEALGGDLLLLHAAADQDGLHGVGAADRQLLVRLVAAGRVGVPGDPDAVVAVLRDDVSHLRDLVHGLRLQVGAADVEEDVVLHVDDDPVLGPLRLGDLLELLRLLVEVEANAAAGERADAGADPGAHERALLPLGERADPRAEPGADDRARARADGGALPGRLAAEGGGEQEAGDGRRGDRADGGDVHDDDPWRRGRAPRGEIPRVGPLRHAIPVPPAAASVQAQNAR